MSAWIDSLSDPPIKTLSGFSRFCIAHPSAKNSGFDNTENLFSNFSLKNSTLKSINCYDVEIESSMYCSDSRLENNVLEKIFINKGIFERCELINSKVMLEEKSNLLFDYCISENTEIVGGKVNYQNHRVRNI